MPNLVATAEIDIDAAPAVVWRALTDPAQIKEYFFGTTVVTDWQPGSPILWKGEYEGTTYEDKGEVLAVEAEHLVKVTHFSPMSGQPDTPDNYHTLVYTLADRGSSTHLVLTQDNNGDEAEAERASATWETVLGALKAFVER